MPTAGGTCTVVNGDEHLDTPCTWTNQQFELQFPAFATRIVATRGADKQLTGIWEMSRLDGGEAKFIATPIDRPDPLRRFLAPATPAPSPTASFAGTWEFQFKTFEVGKGGFTQTSDGVVTGTIIPKAIGDLRYLAGVARGRSLSLSTFDGQHAYLVRAELDETGKALTGEWTYVEVMTDPFTATRVDQLDLAVVDKLRLRDGATRVTLPQLAEPAFAGKPLIIDYFGTWCPACMDETPFLVELYRRYHAAGLEILSIALESTTDDAYNRKQVDYFRSHYQIPWRIDVLPGEMETSEKLLPPELEGTGGYPITLFIARDGTVVDLHSGFLSPSAGDDYRRLRERFEATVKRLVAPPTP
ncbi:MAG: TlpA disulfide reductase family protein [Proteobacteria bacterium]|nr:TlpA disulfide reductase family protein [Pseudomonadota bacterium]